MSSSVLRYRPFRLEVSADLAIDPDSCLHVGAGEQWHPGTDMPVARMGDIAYIPGSSLRGVLRHYLEERYDSQTPAMRSLFGYVEPPRGLTTGTSRSGSLAVSDAMPDASVTCPTETRDYVRIDRETGAAGDRAKFDAEAVTSGSFQFHLVYEGDGPQDDALRLLGAAFQAITEGSIRVGGKSSKGFGKMKLSAVKYLVTDRSTDVGLLDYWDARLGSPKAGNFVWPTPPAAGTTFEEVSFQFKIEFDGPTLVRAPLPPKPDAFGKLKPDHVFVTSEGKAYLPGASLRGVLSTQAEKIVKTLRLDRPRIFVPLFGEASGADSGLKGMIEIGDGTLLTDSTVCLDHVALDRITQTPVSGKKFAALALASPHFNVDIRLKYNGSQLKSALLAAFVLRDLCEGRLWAGASTSRGYGRIRCARVQAFSMNGKIHSATSWADLKPWWGALPQWQKESDYAR